MKAVRLSQHELAASLAGRKCRFCRKSCRIGQTVLYDSGNVVYHRTCFKAFAAEMYSLLPLQEDEHEGHTLFAETAERASQREFEEYRAKIVARGQK